jgi:hypothetical protein
VRPRASHSRRRSKGSTSGGATKPAVPNAHWRSYQEIQAFKADPRASIDGVNYARVIAIYLYDRTLVGWLKKVVFSLFYAPTISSSSTGTAQLFYSYRHKHRLDYDYIVEHIRDLEPEKLDYAESVECLSAFQPFWTLANFPAAWRASGGYSVRPYHRLASALLVAKYMRTAQLLERSLPQRDHVVTFCDAAPDDNLVAQLSKRRGATTLTTQHGQYRSLGPANMSQDAEAYANFVSDYLLAWGKATVIEFEGEGIDPHRLITVGWIRRWPDARAPEKPTQVFGVLLNGANGSDSNEALLDLAETLAHDLDMRYIVRTHPSYDLERYRSIASDRCQYAGTKSAEDYVSEVDFSLSHMSGATIEMIQVSSPVIVVDDGRLASVFKLPGMTVTSASEAIEKVHEMRSGLALGNDLKGWFNDDADQDAKIRNAITRRTVA